MTAGGRKSEVLVELGIGAPIGTVWTALRDPAQLANWFGWEAPGLDVEIAYIFQAHAHADRESRRIDFGEWEGVSTRIELAEGAGETVLSLSRAGLPEAVDGPLYNVVSEGWVTFVQQLRLLVERDPTARRRTLYLGAKARPGERLTEHLGIGRLRGEAPGAPTVLEPRPGAPLAGTLRHTTPFQIGIDLPAYEGMLVATDTPPDAAQIHGAGALLITSFGLSEAGFAAMEADWSAWWAEHFAP